MRPCPGPRMRGPASRRMRRLGHRSLRRSETGAPLAATLAPYVQEPSPEHPVSKLSGPGRKPRLVGLTTGYTVGMTVQVAVKLPDELAAELDRLVQSGAFDSRSEALRAGLEEVIATREHELLRERYREAMARHPETAKEIADARRLAAEAIEEEPWERWW